MSDEVKIKLSGKWPRSTWKAISPGEIAPVRALYHKARFLDAYELAGKIAPLQAWSGGSARTFAADLAVFLAGYRLSDWLDVTAWRSDPQEETALLNFVTVLRNRRGPLLAWWFLDKHPIQPKHSPYYRFHWHTQRANLAVDFRDFERAKRFAAEAMPFCERPELPPMAECRRLRAQDELDAALEKAREAYAINPAHVAAQRQIVEILTAQNDDEACFSFLRDALDLTQDGYLLSLKIRLLFEREEFSSAVDMLDLYEKWSPLREEDGRRWLWARRCDAFYHLERFDEAVASAQQSGTEYYRAFAVRLKEERQRKWVRLPVGFIRQDHNTCGPATLTALANFWGQSADHGQVAQDVGYDGSYDFQERKWVEENGFYVREFKVTWKASQTLIDRGIPFAMATAWPGGAHLQAVIGYDSVWRTFLIRDPGVRDIVEFDWKKTEEDYRAVGPRGMAFVPKAKKELLSGLALPETEIYDGTYEISLALDHHSRDEALKIQADLEKRFPGERMTIQGRRLIANYDDNVPELMGCMENLLKLFPGDERLSLTLLSCLRDLGRREDRLELLRALVNKKDCHPLIWKEFAAELDDDSRERAKVFKYLLRAHRKMPSQTNTVSRIADALWNQGKIKEAAEVYRFAACMDHKKEPPSRSYFIATRHTRQTEEAVAFLRARFDEYGPHSPDPIRTLFYALEQLDRVPEAFAALSRALEVRPRDGELLCYAAETCRSYGRREEARRHLREAEKESPRPRWLRTAGRLAGQSGELDEALECWKEVARLQPLADDAHGEVADLLFKTRGRQAAISYLRGIYDRFPHNLAIGKLLLAWVKKEDPEKAIELCRALVASHPADAWTTRELAVCLSLVPAHVEEAWHYAQVGRDLEPRASAAYNVLAGVRREMGRIDEARELFREAIRLEVDNPYAIEHLIGLGATQEEKRRDLLFIRGELVRQVVFGNGLSEFREQAERALPPEEVLAYLEEARAERPDLWYAWHNVMHQLIHMGRGDDALAIALETSRKFPLVAESWRNLGEAYSLRDRWKDAAEAYEKAVEISANWITAIGELSDAYRKMEDWPKARAVLETALKHSPTSNVLHGYLAELNHFEGKHAEAIEELKQALELSPSYGWGWTKLSEWGDSEECVKVCRTLTQKRPGDAEAWRRLADNLDAEKDSLEILEALDRAIALEPQDESAYDIKAYTLTRKKCFDEALKACRPGAWGDFTPINLRGRAAWVENERGDRRAAIAAMRAVVTDDSSYYWGWERLSDWLLEENQVNDAVKAAEQLTRLRPSSAMAWGYRADARLKQGNRHDALEDLRRAHVLDPDYGFATWTMFDLLIDDEEFDEAAKLLADARRYSDPAKVLKAQIGLDLGLDDKAVAAGHLRELAGMENCNVKLLEGIEREYQKKSALDDFDRILNEMVANRSASGAVLNVWARRRVLTKRRGVAAALSYYIQNLPGVGRAGVNSYFNALGEADRFTADASTLLRRYAAFLRQETYTWGLVGFALNCSGKFARCARWLSDWRDQEKLQRWMLVNLAQSLRNLSQDSEADEVCKRILEIEPENVFGNLYLGLDLALNGDHVSARKHLEKFVEKDLAVDMRFYFLLLHELLAAETASDHSAEVFRKTRARLAGHLAKLKGPLPWHAVRARNLTLSRLASRHRAAPEALQYRLCSG